MNALIGYRQGQKADTALKALQSQLQITVRVKRDGACLLCECAFCVCLYNHESFEYVQCVCVCVCAHR